MLKFIVEPESRAQNHGKESSALELCVAVAGCCFGQVQHCASLHTLASLALRCPI